jgi:hypothetical protein
MPDHVERFPSARDIEKIARNPECKTLRTSLAANVDLRKFAVDLGLEEERQSPIALARGNAVERFVLGKRAARLVERLQEDGKIGTDPWIEDLSKRAPNRAGMEKAADRTDEFIAARLAGTSAPDILIHPVLRIQLGPDIQFLEPDSLIAYPDEPLYEPMELKSYPFRYGKTDHEDLRQARRQGAVYVHALRGRVTALGGDMATIRTRVTLVFTRPDSLYPRPIYHESVEGEMRDAEHAVQLLEDAKVELDDLARKGTDIKTLLPTLDIHYTEKCLSFCSLAKRCRESCSSAGKVAVLGERPGRVLAPAVTIGRAMELLSGSKPRDDGEETLARRMTELIGGIGALEEAR